MLHVSLMTQRIEGYTDFLNYAHITELCHI